MLKDFGLLGLRVVCGGLLTGHGSQKLFGWFEGPGIEGTQGFMESLGLEPSKGWAGAAGGSELTGGLLTTLGLFHPIGPIIKLGPMMTAIRQVHWMTPVWATEGGAELPLTNMAVGVALATNEPGRLSLDYLFGIRVPRFVALLVLAGVIVGWLISEAQTAQMEQEGNEQGETQAEYTRNSRNSSSE
jgi:putative oxidoreductase